MERIQIDNLCRYCVMVMGIIAMLSALTTLFFASVCSFVEGYLALIVFGLSAYVFASLWNRVQQTENLLEVEQKVMRCN